MKNLVSHNQLAEWRHYENTLDSLHFSDQDDQIDEYFDCLIECDDNASQCRRVCSEILR
jgi:hypothetical protein